MLRKIVIVSTVVAIATLGLATPAEAASSWGSAAIPVPAVANGALDGIDCEAGGFCIAVGEGAVADGTQVALSEVPGEDGYLRKRVAAPADATDTALHGVDCRSATFCIGVGEYTDGAPFDGPHSLIERWNGAAWQVVEHAPAGYDGERLRSVSCATVSFCMAVGEVEVAGRDLDGTLAAAKTLIEFWDGSTWRVVGSPSPNRYSRLRGVSCPTVRFCVAVGTDGTGEGDAEQTGGLREVLTPQGWVVSTDSTNSAKVGPETGGRYGVSCSSATFCLDVGWGTTFTGGPYPYAEVWNGAAWTGADTSAWPRDAYRLEAVSCTSPTSCTALAGAETAESRTQAGAWDGAALTPTRLLTGDLAGVACRTTTHCTAVGTDATPVVTVRTGTRWRPVAAASVSGDAGSELTAISCTSYKACVAVGDQVGPDGLPRSLAEVWNGHRWQPIDVPTPADAVYVHYAALSCATTTFCVAAGYFDTGGQGYSRPLLQVWDGTSWTEPQPNFGGIGFDGVSCTSATFCLAVGYHSATTWDGARWTRSPAPDPSKDFAPYGLTCVTATDCTVVGIRYGVPYPQGGATIQHWNGTSWTRVAAPPGPRSAYDILTSVSCATADSCVAVGYSDNGPSVESLLDTWDGTTWRATPHPDRPAMLSAVSCSAPGSCAAVGTNAEDGLTSSDGVWDDASIYAPLGSTKFASDLAAISCVPEGTCRAVGSFARASGAVAFSAETYLSD